MQPTNYNFNISSSVSQSEYVHYPSEKTLYNSTQLQNKKTDLFLSSVFIGLALICMTLASNYVYGIFEHFSAMLGIKDDTVYYDSFRYILTTSLWMFLSFVFACILRRKKMSETVSFQGTRFSLFIGGTLLCCAGMATGNILSGFLSQLFPKINNPLLYETPQINSVVEFIVQLLYVAALPALVEEFCFRGVVLGLLKPHGKIFAVIASSFIFSFIHGNFAQIPFTFILGLFFAYVTVISDSVWPAVTAHFINNATSCIISYLSQGFDDTQSALTGLALYASWIALGIIGATILVVSYLKRKTPQQTGCNVQIKTSFGSQICRFWLCPTILIATVYYFHMAVMLLIW